MPEMELFYRESGILLVFLTLIADPRTWQSHQAACILSVCLKPIAQLAIKLALENH